jgi:hypothetical protein
MPSYPSFKVLALGLRTSARFQAQILFRCLDVQRAMSVYWAMYCVGSNGRTSTTEPILGRADNQREDIGN